MYEFQGIDFGPTEVTVEADTLRGALDQMGQLYNLHKDALFLEAHVAFFYDEEADVVPRSRDDDEGFQYRGFECLRTGCNITFKETEEDDGLFPGRYRAYRNGNDNPKLYDPNRSPEEILEKVAPDTPFVQHFGVDVGQNSPSSQRPTQRGQKPSESASAANPSGDPAGSSTQQKGHDSEALYNDRQQAGQTLVNRVQAEHEDGELAREVRISGSPLPEKLRSFAAYCDRETGYLSRVVDALGVASVEEVAVGQLSDAVAMILDEDTLQQNESFKPDDDLPF